MLTPPSECQVAKWTHRPVATRYVKHHIQPQTAGGKTVPENLATRHHAADERHPGSAGTRPARICRMCRGEHRRQDPQRRIRT